MFEFYSAQFISIVVPGAFMYWRGKKYAAKESTTTHGAILRAIGWSFLFCWSVLFVRGQGFAIIPLPSLGAVIVWLYTINESINVRTQLIPYPLLSPAIPVAIYLLAFKLNHSKTQTIL